MSLEQLNVIESHLMRLLESERELKQENTFLRNKVNQLTRHNARQNDKQRVATQQVKQLIAHLKGTLK